MTAFTQWGFDITAGGIALGLFTGLTYGLLAAGLVLVFRASKFVNFAHGAIGVFGAAITSIAVQQFELPYWISVGLGMLAAAGVGALCELGVVAPLARQPKVLSMIATLGMSTFLIFTSLGINPTGLSGSNFPKPAGMPTGSIGNLKVTEAFAAQAIISPLVMIGLGVMLTRSALGLRIRATSSMAEAAETSGISARRTSLQVWALAGAIAAISVILIIPTKGTVTPESLGPELLIRGLAAAAIARFRSYWKAIAIAGGIGVLEQIAATNDGAKGAIEVVIFAALMLSLLTSRKAPRTLPEQWYQRSLGPVRTNRTRAHAASWVGTAAVVALGLYIPFAATGSQAFDGIVVLSMIIVVCSVVVITALGGQLSLAQFAYAGIGAAVAVSLSPTIGFIPAIVCGGAVSALAAMVLTWPTLRVESYQLGVATLVFALVSNQWLLPKLFGTNNRPERPQLTIAGISTNTARGYFWVAFIAAVLVIGFVWRLRQSAWARMVAAVRDNAEHAQALAIPVQQVSVQLAACGGVIAGIGGAIYGHAYSSLAAENFPVQFSIDAVTATVIGGLGSLLGPVIAAVYLVGIPAFFAPTSEARSALSGAWIAFITKIPGGAGELARRIRSGIGTAEPVAETAPEVAPLRRVKPLPDQAAPAPLLEIVEVTKRYGGIVAVDTVSVSITQGEIVGLIGPNGAGKTTLFEMVSGFVGTDGGRILFRGHDIAKRSAHRRAAVGIARTFQSANLFPPLPCRKPSWLLIIGSPPLVSPKS